MKINVPVFKRLELDDFNIIDEFLSKFPPYNDFEFASLWTYNTLGKNVYSFINNNLVIKIQDFITGKFFYSFLGTNKVIETASFLLELSKKEGLGSSLYLIPEVNIKSTVGIEKTFDVKEDLSSFDYILSVSEIAELKGNKYYDKRNLVNRFRKTHSNYQIRRLDLKDITTRKEILDLFQRWIVQKNARIEDTEMERVAINKLFDLVDIINIFGIGIYIQNILIGFAIYHLYGNKYAIMTFEKGDIAYSGIYALLNHEAAKHLNSLDVEYLNYEQDLGIPGLRKSKSLWRPVSFLKKYIISK